MLSVFAACTLFGVVSADEYGNHEQRPAVIARGGGFPVLEPRSPDTRLQRRNHAIEQPTYRVADAEGSELAASELSTDVPLDGTSETSRSKMIAPLVTVGSSLAIVLALFCALVWVGRKFGGRSAASKPLPASALTPLGHVMLDPRTKLLLVKCGRRILVLSQTASGITPITEVTHPDEVRELIANCSAEAREAFQRTLREIELEPARGFTDPTTTTPPRSARHSGRLFTTA
jgi:flagellar biosynthetic protein FliO